MEARVVGGRVTLLLMAALLACDIAPPRSPAAGPAAAAMPASEAPTMSAPVVVDVSEAPVVGAPSEPAPSRVVLVTIDGVRWQDVFAGATDEQAPDSEPMMPSLHRLVGAARRGVRRSGVRSRRACERPELRLAPGLPGDVHRQGDGVYAQRLSPRRYGDGARRGPRGRRSRRRRGGVRVVGQVFPRGRE